MPSPPRKVEPPAGDDPGITREAHELLQASEVIDLHVETFLARRLIGYDISRAHDRWNPGHFLGHLDAPGIRAGGLGGAMWSITANVFLPARARWRAFLKNVHDLDSCFYKNNMRSARTYAEYRRKRKTGRHVGLLAIQGANVCEAAPDGGQALPEVITRVTLMHLTNSVFGAASTPVSYLRRERGLSPRGRELVNQLNARRIFVDLAHIHPRGFHDAVDCHARDLPLIVTHTGVNGVKPHWRNLSDEQIRAVASSGGVIGVIFSDHFLRPRGRRGGAEIVLDHIEHIIRAGGERAPAIGSDFDGMIVPPADLRDGRAYGRLVAAMLARGWSQERIEGILGENFLRSFRIMRPGV